jgi:Flp pilus assembly protein TadB
VEDGVSEKAAEKSEKRSIEDVQAEIEETRRRLAENLAQLKQEAAPKAIIARAKEGLASVFVNPETGSVRTERVVAVASVTVGLILVRKGMKSRAHKRELRRLGEVVWVPVPRSSVRPDLIPVARNAAELGPAAPLPALTAA